MREIFNFLNFGKKRKKEKKNEIENLKIYQQGIRNMTEDEHDIFIFCIFFARVYSREITPQP